MTKATKTKIVTKTATTLATFAEAKRIVRKLGLKNHQAYSWMKIEGRKPATLPDQPKIQYARYWKGWNDFFGVEKAQTSCACRVK